MIVFANGNGNILKTIPLEVHQGSNKASTIYFIAPFDSDIVNIAFTLPNGKTRPQRIMTRLTDFMAIPELKDVNGKEIGVWGYSLPQSITAYYGQVSAQIFVTNTNEEIISTSEFSFNVLKGVAHIEPPKDTDSYQQLLSLISNIIHALGNKYEKVEGIDLIQEAGVIVIHVHGDDGSTNIRPGSFNVIDNAYNMLAITPESFNASRSNGDFIQLNFPDSSGTIATEEQVEDNYYAKVDSVSIDAEGISALNVFAVHMDAETLVVSDIITNGIGISMAYGEKFLKYPEELGEVETIATREWVNAQGFGSGSSSVDVQINGTSIVKDGVANIPVASTNKLGVINTVDIEKNKTDIKLLYAGLKQKNIIIPATLDNTAKARQTANGLTVVDGSTATVNKIVGNTVKSRNICLPISARSVQDFGAFENTAIRQITENAIYLGVSGGNYYRGSNSVKDLSITSEKITATLIGEFYGIGIPVRVASDVDIVITAKTTTTDGYRLSYMFFDKSGNFIKGTATDGKLHTPENAYWLIIIFENGGKANSTITISDIMVEYGTTATKYQPYFSFKNAKISGIKSTGRNLFVSPHLRTPKIYDPTNISENDIYYGLTYTGAQYENAITNVTTTEGGITFKQNMGQSIALGFPVRVAGLSSVAVRMFVSFPDTSQTASFYNGHIFLDGNGNRIDNNAQYITPKDGLVTITNRTVPENAEWLIFCWGERYDTLPNRLASFSKIMMVAGETEADYEPYFAPSVMSLPETEELGKWDYIENGQIVRQTIIETFDGAKYDETAGTYNGTTDFILTEDRTKVAYKGTATITELSFDNTYKVWDKGTEQMQLENSESVPTITAEYLILGGAE